MGSIRARLHLYVPSDIDEEMREESTRLIEEAVDRIEALEEQVEWWQGQCSHQISRIEALEALLRSCRDAMRHSRDHQANTDWSHMIAAIEAVLAPEPLTTDTIDLTNPLPGDPPKAGEA